MCRNASDSKQRRVADATQNIFAQPTQRSKGLDGFKLAWLRRGCNPLEQSDVPYIRPVYSQFDASRSAKDKPRRTAHESLGCKARKRAVRPDQKRTQNAMTYSY